jgi:hypothetical protein
MYRYDPDEVAEPFLPNYTIDLKEAGPRIVDAPIKIKDEADTALTLRRSCREGIGGSCAMTVSGKNGPAGLFYIEPDANAIEIQPDLVPDLINFYNQYKSVELKAVTEGSGKGITSDLPDGNTVTVGGERFRRRRRHHFECSDQRVARTAAPQACHSFVAIHAPSNCTLDVIAWSAVISAL